MRRFGLALALAACSPAAVAWVACDEAGITPPVAMEREPPAYPESVREAGIEGAVELSLTVLRDGRVGWVRVSRGEPRGYFEQAAAAGVRRWRFEPARTNGVPIECRMRTRVRFTLVDTIVTGAAAASGAGPTPAYPAALLGARVEGYVEVEFDLAPDGSVRDARVIAAMPRGEFERAALAAIHAWRAEPSSERERHGSRRFEFRLPDSTLATAPTTVLGSAPFPMQACERRLRGRVALEVGTDASGRVLEARILSATPRGLFDRTALAVARASRLSPAYRDGQPIAAKALMTLFFDPEKATCPGTRSPGRDAPPYRPEPRVGITTKRPLSAPTG